MRGFVYFCDWKIISGMKKLGIIMAILLHVIVGFAQRSITVGAKIETDFQIWYLDSIVLSNDSTTLKWHVESKGNTYACMSLFPTMVDPDTMKEYHMKHVWGIAKEPDKTILNPGEVRSFISTFSRISKSTKQLDYNGNVNFWVKGINLKRVDIVRLLRIFLQERIFYHSMIRSTGKNLGNSFLLRNKRKCSIYQKRCLT